MPDVRIQVIRGRTPAEKKALLDAVHAALVEALAIPEDDRVQLLDEYAPESFERPPGKSDRYVRIEATMFPGRSLDAKRRLYQAIVRNLGPLGVEPKDVKVVLYEPPMENWGVRGGVPASEVDLGFEVRV